MSSILFNFADPMRKPFARSVRFTPLDTPQLSRGTIIASSEFTQTPDASGFLVVNLVAGRYRVSDGCSRAYVIQVPDDDRLYLVEHLFGPAIARLAASPSTQQPNIRYVQGIPLFTNPTAGTWHALRLADGPVIQITEDGSDGLATVSDIRFSGRQWQIRNPVSGDWHTPFIGTHGGGLAISLQPAGAAGPESIANWRLKPGLFQLLHRTTGQWHTFYIGGTAGALSIQIAAGES